jgi:3-isopropylmalate dehydrogenase
MACKMMLDHLGEERAAQLIEDATIRVIGNHLKSLEAGKMGHTTTEVGELVAQYVARA